MEGHSDIAGSSDEGGTGGRPTEAKVRSGGGGATAAPCERPHSLRFQATPLFTQRGPQRRRLGARPARLRRCNAAKSATPARGGGARARPGARRCRPVGFPTPPIQTTGLSGDLPGKVEGRGPRILTHPPRLQAANRALLCTNNPIDGVPMSRGARAHCTVSRSSTYSSSRGGRMEDLRW